MTRSSRHIIDTLLVGAVALAVAAVVPALAFAAEGHGAGHHGSVWDLRYYVINFTLFVILMYVLTKKQIVAGWADRRNAIRDHVERSKRALEQATKKSSELETKLKSLDAELAMLKTQIKAEGEREAAALEDEGAERIAKLKEHSKSRAQAERKSVENALRGELAEQVLARAEQMIRERVNADVDGRLRHEAAEKVTQLVH